MNSKRKKVTTQHSEQGYALIAIVGILMFALILTTAAAPMIKRESQREKEEEMLWRGQQIAQAIQAYGGILAAASGKKPLTNLKQLVEGEERPGAAGGTKIGKVRYLRPSALCDPLMPCKFPESNWGLVYPTDDVIKEFRAALEAAMSKLPLNSPERNQLAFALAQLPGGTGGQLTNSKLGDFVNDGKDKDSDSDSGIGGNKRPIAGVVSQRGGEMFRNYYGVEKYEKAPFLPGVPVLVGGIIPPIGYTNAAGGVGVAVNKCPDGGPMVLGSCNYGRLNPGQLCRGPNGESVPCPGR